MKNTATVSQDVNNILNYFGEAKIWEMARHFSHYNTAFKQFAATGCYTRNVSEAHIRCYESFLLDNEGGMHCLRSSNNPDVTHRGVKECLQLSIKKRTPENIKEIIRWATSDHRAVQKLELK